MLSVFAAFASRTTRRRPHTTRQVASESLNDVDGRYKFEAASDANSIAIESDKFSTVDRLYSFVVHRQEISEGAAALLAFIGSQ